MNSKFKLNPACEILLLVMLKKTSKHCLNFKAASDKSREQNTDIIILLVHMADLLASSSAFTFTSSSVPCPVLMVFYFWFGLHPLLSTVSEPVAANAVCFLYIFL